MSISKSIILAFTGVRGYLVLTLFCLFWHSQAQISNDIRFDHTINAPWWEALWFKLSLILGVTSLIGGAFWVSISESRRRRKILEQRVEERTKELVRMNNELKAYDHMISHDLKGPIGNINMIVGYIHDQEDLALSDENRELFDQVRKSTKRAINLINDILSFAAADKTDAHFQSVDLKERANEAIAAHRMTITTNKAMVTAMDLPNVEKGVPVKVYQLFYNLIGNALKFQSPDNEPIITIWSRQVGEKWEVIVEDNGIGFDPKHANEIFNPLTRLHTSSEYEGSGLGLAICQRIVDLHGWTIRAESTKGEGSRFIVTI